MISCKRKAAETFSRRGRIRWTKDKLDDLGVPNVVDEKKEA